MTLRLPPPRLNAPTLTRVISNPLFPADKDPATGEYPAPYPTIWKLGAAHPFVNDMVVVRMFDSEDSVVVYSLSSDERLGVRNTIPMHSIRLIEEGMSPGLLVDELEEAESEEDNEPEEEEDSAPEETSPNGQVASA